MAYHGLGVVWSRRDIAGEFCTRCGGLTEHGVHEGRIVFDIHLHITVSCNPLLRVLQFTACALRVACRGGNRRGGQPTIDRAVVPTSLDRSRIQSFKCVDQCPCCCGIGSVSEARRIQCMHQ